jgi:hypothetical protein
MLSEIEKYINDNYDNDDNNYNKLYEKLINLYTSDIEIQEIKLILYDKFSYKITNKNLRDERDEQEKFRKKLIKLDNTCIISGDDPEQCQACHIIPVCESESYNTNNGILLNYNFHNMFDRFKFGFEFIKNIDKHYDLYKIILSNTIINKSTYNNYKIYDNKEIKIRKECRKNLQQKYNEFIIKNKHII